jgi:hypothetical protein
MTTDAIETRDRPWWRRALNWGDLLEWGPLVVAAIVYVSGDNPLLAVALACLKFGADDVRTAAWIRSVDPDPIRGRATAWLHRALGLGKVAFLGLVAMGLTGAVLGLVHPVALGQAAIGHLLNQTFSGLMVATFASVAAALLALPGIVLARRHRLRVWIDWRAGRARRHGAWPPCDPRPEAPRHNLLDLFLIGDGVGLCWLAALAGMSAFWVGPPGLADALQRQLIGGLVCAASLALIPVWIKTMRTRSATRFEECYPEPPASVAAAD